MKQNQGSPSSPRPAPGPWPLSEAQRRAMTTRSKGGGPTCLLQSVGAIIPSTPTWETNCRGYCLERMVFLLLYRIQSCLFILLDCRINQVHSFLFTKKPPVYHLQTDLIASEKYWCGAAVFYPLKSTGGAEMGEKRQRRKLRVFREIRSSGG